MNDWLIIIPSLDPDQRLIGYCEAIRAALPCPILLVDDGSRFDKRKIFAECIRKVSGINLLRHNQNMGKGRALKDAFLWAFDNLPSLTGCITVDSDGQHLVKDVIRCLEAGRQTPRALVLGCRTFSGEHVPWKSSFGNNWTRFLFLLITGRSFMDTQTGLRVIPMEFMRRLIDFPGERFDFETEMLLGMCEMPLIQISIDTVYEHKNQGTHFRAIEDSIKIVRVIFRAWARRMGLFILSALSSFVLDTSLFYLLYYYLLTPNAKGCLLLSILLARIVSMIYNYSINAVIVFKSELTVDVKEVMRFTKYLCVAIGVFMGSYGLTKTFCLLMPNVNIVALKIAADFIMFLLSYFVQRTLVYSPRQKH